MRQALSRIDDIPQESRTGFYGGRTGVAAAAARAGELLRETGLMERASQVVQSSADVQEVDLIAGKAGAIVGLLLLWRLLDRSSFLDQAQSFGEELLETAEPDRRGLTGFSHGAAGVGYSLLELFVATRDGRYCKGAEQAFAYERALYDPESRNWPDLRDQEDGHGEDVGRVSFSTSWCHGAPGIALSRLRAFEILGRREYRQEALDALETTRTSVVSTLESRVGNYSLCHGLAGNAEIVAEGRCLLDAAADLLAEEVGRAGIEAYGSSGVSWPCGTQDGETPSLMLGLAGIGYFYLRLHDRSVPSILLPRPN
jgi:lantibiotic modifying enzyme